MNNACGCKLVPRCDSEYVFILCERCIEEANKASEHLAIYGASAMKVVPGEGIKHVILDSGIENASTL